MQDFKIEIRPAMTGDCQVVFEWRIDERSRAMFFNQTKPTIEEHRVWFEESIISTNREIFIGERSGEKIGICRFDLDKSQQCAEVSINISPNCRGQGLGKIFLLESVEYYLDSNKCDLIARIKKKNYASLNIFNYAGFCYCSSDEEEVVLKRPYKEFLFKKVDLDDAESLFELLKKRSHSISHTVVPSEQEHLEFVKSQPYRYWTIILEDGCLIGSFYIQNDNSIGINLLEPEKILVYKILRHIRCNFKPVKEVKSKIPPYFYINVSYTNEALKTILGELNAIPIQTSYMI